MSLIDGFNKIIDAGKNGDDLLSAIIGSNGAGGVAEAIKQLDSDLVNGLVKVVSAINNGEYLTEWAPFQNSMKAAYTQSMQYIQELNSLVQNTPEQDQIFPSGWNVTIQSAQLQDFNEWCQTSLPILGMMFSAGQYTIDNNNYWSLPSMFSNLMSDPDGNILDLWQKLAEGAQGSSNSVLSKYYGKSRYELTFELMEEFFMLIGMIYYTHEAALKLLVVLYNSGVGNLISLRQELLNNFAPQKPAGAYTNCWAEFRTKLNNMVIIPAPNGAGVMLNGQDMITAHSTQSYIGPIQTGEEVGDTYISWLVLTNKVAVPEGSYMTAVQFFTEQDQNQNETLQLIVHSYNPVKKLAFTSQTINTDEAPTIWVGSPNTESTINYMCQGYGNPTATQKNNQINVVTGVQLKPMNANQGIGNQLGIYTQWGILDVTNPDKPEITVSDPTFYEPVDSSCFDVAQQSYINPAGSYGKIGDNFVNNQRIVTNVSLMANNAGNGLVVQTAPAFCNADYMQPINLPQIQGLPTA